MHLLLGVGVHAYYSNTRGAEARSFKPRSSRSAWQHSEALSRGGGGKTKKKKTSEACEFSTLRPLRTESQMVFSQD
jgi:hypothetical protein